MEKGLDFDEIRTKIEMYCSRAEHSAFSVRKKLFQWKVPANDIGNIIQYLEQEGFIDERRYAMAFAHDRLKFGKCGRNKIRYELRGEQISDRCVAEALQSLDKQLYDDTLHDVAQGKLRTLSAFDRSTKSVKLTAFLLSRGFERELITKEINNLLK